MSYANRLGWAEVVRNENGWAGFGWDEGAAEVGSIKAEILLDLCCAWLGLNRTARLSRLDRVQLGLVSVDLGPASLGSAAFGWN